MSIVSYGFTAQQLINEDRLTEEDVENIKTWAAEQESLPKLTDEQIALFLLSCSKKPERTKRTITSYYSIRKQAPNLFDNRLLDGDDLQKQMNTFNFCIFPELTDEGNAIVYSKLNDTNYQNADMEPAMKLCLMVLDAVIYDCPPKGLIVLLDFQGVGLMHLTRIKLGLTKLFFTYVQEALQVKLVKIHILNTVYFIDKLMGMLTPFIKKEVLQFINFHQSDMDLEKFYRECVPKRCLHKELGGNLPSLVELQERSTRKLYNMEWFFQAEELQRHEHF